MPSNNSKTNTNARRAAALSRFSLDPKKSEDAGYQQRKAQEKEALQKIKY